MLRDECPSCKFQIPFDSFPRIETATPRLRTFGVRCFQDFIFRIRLTSRKAVVIANCKDKFEFNLDPTRFIQHLARLEISFRVSSACSGIQRNRLPVLLLHSHLIVKRKSVNVIVTINSNNVSLKLSRMFATRKLESLLR